MATPVKPSKPTSTTPLGKLVFIALVVAGASWLAFPLREKITLGLDLQGGTHLVLQADLDQAVRGATDRAAEGIRRELAEAGIVPQRIFQEEGSTGRLVIEGVPADKVDAARDVLDRYEGGWDVSAVGSDFRLSMTPNQASDVRQSASRQVKETIGRRINAFGVGEQQLSVAGSEGERLVLQLPGLDDAERVKRIITKASVLEFREVRVEESPSREAVVAALGGAVPQDVEIVQGAPDTRHAGKWFGLARGAIARGDDLIGARDTEDEMMRPAIGFDLGGEGARAFGDFTARNVGKFMAIVLDGEVYNYASIKEPIPGRGQITGNFTVQEAADSALTLRSGALPAKVHILFEQTVGPSLGRDSIAAGVRAAILGLVIVVVFMLVWYKAAGVNAVVALALNMVLILAMMSAIPNAALTLPGIAGMILTIGMAVDANVIIFERIKEEMHAGKSPQGAVDAGFDKAFSSILDSNLTTFIAAFFLYNFGTGPIKGFAITLMLGLICSMFTAIYVSRALFETVEWLRPGRKRLSIEWTHFKTPSIPFMKLGPLMGGISLAAVVLSLGLFVVKGPNYGIDFEGGTQVVVAAKEGTTADDLRQRLAGTEFSDIVIQQFGAADEHQFLMRLHGAEAAVATTQVNQPQSPEAREEKASAGSRLIGVLLGGSTSRLDLNAAGTLTMAEALRGFGGLSLTEAEAAADAIAEARAESGGLFSTVDEAAAAIGPGPAADWLRANAVVGDLAVITSESVGPTVGDEMKGQARSAILWSLLGILAYMWFRFELRYGVAAVLAVVHDVAVTVGILVLLGVEFDVNVVAALLTLVGYSLNDTIVMFDRVRENLRTLKNTHLSDVLDLSVNQTLSRTVLTAGTVFAAVLALLLLGGPVLYGFSLAMTVGVVAGTYSTTFVASPIVLAWNRLAARRLRREAAA